MMADNEATPPQEGAAFLVNERRRDGENQNDQT